MPFREQLSHGAFVRAHYHRLRRLTILLLPLCLLAAAVARPAAAGEARPSVASINTCADQVLIAIADPGRIVGLSAFATDPGISFYAEEAKRFRILGTSAEELLKLRPDIVFASLYLDPEMKARLESFGMRVVTIGLADSIEASEAQIMEIARAIGEEARGRDLVRRIEDRLAAIDRPANAGISVLQLQRRGFTSGSHTLLADLLSRFGLRSAAAELGVRDIARVDLETLLKLHPDILVTDSAVPEADDQGTALLRHPALREAYPPERRIVLPSRLTVCGGPSLPAAIDTLSQALKRVRTQPGE